MCIYIYIEGDGESCLKHFAVVVLEKQISLTIKLTKLEAWILGSHLCCTALNLSAHCLLSYVLNTAVKTLRLSTTTNLNSLA